MNASVLRKFLSSITIFSLALVLSACQSATTDNSGASQSAGQEAGSQQAASDQQAGGQQAVEAPPVVVEPDPEPVVKPKPKPKPKPVVNPLLSQTLVFFDYDQSSIRSEYRAVLAAHAANLVANPRLRVRLEGHADERGSREYNIGLGERRAQAVKRALMLSGVAAGALETISYGEEKPMMQGSGETSWSQNRRVEIVYR